MMVMMMPANGNCLKEEQLSNQSRKIAELEAKAEFKDKRIDDILEDNKRMEDKIDKLTDTVNQIMLKSVTGDNTLNTRLKSLEEAVKKMNEDNLSQRMTALESSRDTTYKLIGIAVVVLGCLEFVLKYVKL